VLGRGEGCLLRGQTLTRLKATRVSNGYHLIGTIKTKQQKWLAPVRRESVSIHPPLPHGFPHFPLLFLTLGSMHKYFDKANIYQLLCSPGLWLSASKSKVIWSNVMDMIWGCLPPISVQEIQSQSCLPSYMVTI